MFATDLDDTLYREIDYVMSGYRAIADELERAHIMRSSEVVEVLETAENTWHGLDNLAARIWQAHPDTKYSSVDWMLDIYRNHTPDIRLMPEVRETLENISNAGHKIGIITDGRSSTQRAKIEALGLLDLISPENIIISSEVGGDKTTRLPFDKMISNNPHEKQFVYLGDNPAKDFRWPNAMGWTTVELKDCDGKNIHPQSIEVPDNFKAKYIITDFPDILNVSDRM